MTELFEEEDGEISTEEETFAESDEDVLLEDEEVSPSDARRRLEQLLDERRLRDELEDFLDE